MNREEIILAALAPAKGTSHTPVQVQKLLFLIDREISDLIDGPHFNFQPYDYGPFDKAVYDELRKLKNKGHVYIIPEENWQNYMLTKTGESMGEKILNSLPPIAQDYIERVSEFVRKLTFSQLVSAIYKTYPEMRDNSVFQG